MAARKPSSSATPVGKRAANQRQREASVAAHHGAAERMGRVDTAWLRMDTDSNRMVIVGVWVLHPGIRREVLRQRLQERLLCYRRFVQRVEQDAAGARWVDDADFDIDRHLVLETLPRGRAGQEQQALQQRLGQLAMEPLDPCHPLWRFHLIENYRGGSALLVRIHHCIADGIALISVMQSVTDAGTAPPHRPARPVAHDGLVWGAEEWLADALIRPLTGVAVKALTLAGDSAARSFDFWVDPHKGLEQGLLESSEIAHTALQVAADMAALALMPDDAATPLKGQPQGVKQVAWCAPLALDAVKAVGRSLGCSVNDVLLSCVAGAIGGYLRGRGVHTDGQEIRAMVPVNLRPLDQAYRLGNEFGLLPLVLPIGIEHPLERLYEVRRRMQALKGSTQPLLSFGLLAIAGLLVKPAQDALLGLFSRKTTAVMTNVPGPREKLRLCGSTIEESLFWVPQTGSVGLGVSVLSYGGGVQFGVVADVALCPDPQAIIDGFAPEFERLTLLTLMLPWGGDD